MFFVFPLIVMSDSSFFSRKLYCRSENERVPLYTIFINPTKPQEFAVGGRDHRCR